MRPNNDCERYQPCIFREWISFSPMVKMKLSDFSLVKCTGGVNVVFDSEPSRVCSQSQFFYFRLQRFARNPKVWGSIPREDLHFFSLSHTRDKMKNIFVEFLVVYRVRYFNTQKNVSSRTRFRIYLAAGGGILIMHRWIVNKLRYNSSKPILNILNPKRNSKSKSRGPTRNPFRSTTQRLKSKHRRALLPQQGFWKFLAIFAFTLKCAARAV